MLKPFVKFKWCTCFIVTVSLLWYAWCACRTCCLHRKILPFCFLTVSVSWSSETEHSQTKVDLKFTSIFSDEICKPVHCPYYTKFSRQRCNKHSLEIRKFFTGFSKAHIPTNSLCAPVFTDLIENYPRRNCCSLPIELHKINMNIPQK